MLTHPNVVFLPTPGPRHFLQLRFFGLHVPNNQLRVPANYTDPRVADTCTEGRGMRIVSFKYVLSGDGNTGTQQHQNQVFFIAGSRSPELIPTMPMALDEQGRNPKVKVQSERKREGQAILFQPLSQGSNFQSAREHRWNFPL